ncbi:Ribonuclease H domain [Sesbania bispinosa]|nr:Ribonuclease H domain [Sesbania bispinosa]
MEIHENLQIKDNGTSTEKYISWQAPPYHYITLNTDGSAIGNPDLAGYGWIFRDSLGHWITGYHGHSGFSDITKAEILGILQGLKIASERKFRNLICYTDSMYSIHLIKNEDISYHRDAPEIAEIRDLLAHDWRVDLRHTLREGNVCADLLVKRGARDTTSFRLLPDPPYDLQLHLLSDSRGVAFRRS